MKKQKRRINVKTTKKQVVFLIFELIDLIVLPELVIMPFADNDVLCLILLSLIFLIAIIMCALIIKDGRKNYKIQAEELKVLEDKIAKIPEYEDTFTKFDYNKADVTQKRNYLIVSLKKTCEYFDCSYFYAHTFEFSNEEIKELFSGIKMSVDLWGFITDVILNKKTTPSVSKYKTELDGLIKVNSGLFDKQDDCYFDNDVVFNISKEIKAGVKQDTKSGLYSVVFGYYEHFLLSWNDTERTRKYRSKQKALKLCNRIINNFDKRFKNKDYFTISETDKENYACYFFWYMFDTNRLDEEIYLLADYYLYAIYSGNEMLVNAKDINVYYDVIEKYITKKLVIMLENAKYEKDDKLRHKAFIEIDKFFNSKKAEFEDVFKKHSANLMEKYNVTL